MGRLLSWLILFIVPLTASAHGLSGQCLAQGDKIKVQAYFDTGEPAVGAEIRILDAARHEIAAGKTDDHGVWTFPHPGAGRFRVLIEAGPDHRAELKLDLTGERYDEETQVSRGPGRAAFTGFRLAKIASGLVAIAVFAILLRLLLKRGTRPTSSHVQ